MREIFTYGSVGGAPGNRCFYPELDRKRPRLLEFSLNIKVLYQIHLSRGGK